MRILRGFVMLVMVISLVGCLNDTTPTSSTPADTGMKYQTDRIAASPLASGIVTRGGDFIAMNNVADNAPLLQTVGTTAFEICTGSVDPDPVDFQNVNLPDGQRFLQRLQGEVRVVVYQAPVFCSDYPTKLLASGTANFRLVDNDVVPDGPNTNVWGWHINGRLYGPDGQPFQYKSTHRFQFADGVFSVLKRHIILTPADDE